MSEDMLLLETRIMKIYREQECVVCISILLKWVFLDNAMWSSFIVPQRVCLLLGGKETGFLFRWNTREVRRKTMMQTGFSYAPRPCV